MAKCLLWVVEMRNDQTGAWEPTTGVALSRREARSELRREWRDLNPDDQFRVRAYGPAEAQP